MKVCPLAITRVENEAEENGPQDMNAFETSPVDVEAPGIPEEEKKMKASPLDMPHVENEAKENGS
jgi:hypothetical protein